jgi:hypothetical protein
MAIEKRIQVLNSDEEADLYNPPLFSEADQRFFFSFNSIEMRVIKRQQLRQNQCLLAVLLAYFKVT